MYLDFITVIIFQLRSLIMAYPNYKSNQLHVIGRTKDNEKWHECKINHDESIYDVDIMQLLCNKYWQHVKNNNPINEEYR